MPGTPSRPGGVEAIAEKHLRSTLFHELHHTVRGYAIREPGSPDSFMDFVISEGLASVFERDAAGDRPVLWADYPAEVDSWVEELMALPLDAPYADWMFTHPDGRRWIGYRSGAYLVDLAVASSGRSAADLVHASTEDVLDLAGYHTA